MRCCFLLLFNLPILSLVLLSVVACGDESQQPIPVPSGHEEPTELVIGWHDLTPNEEWMESTAISAPHGATRIGMMLDLEVESIDADVSVEMRGFSKDGKPLEWTPAEVTYAQGFTVVARLNPGGTIYGAQLRLPKTLSSKVQHVTFTALVPEPPGAESEYAGDEPTRLGHTKGALSLNQIVKSRASWNAKATLCTSNDPVKSKMAIHHTYSPPSSAGGYAARIRGIQAYHMDVRGWCDIGYHYLVTQDGSVWEGRPVNRRGAHVGGHNTGNIGVSYVGCFQSGACSAMGSTVPTQVSINAGATLVSALSTQYGITKNKDRIKGHMQHPGASTSCPGDNLLSRLGDIINADVSNPSPPVVPSNNGNGEAQPAQAQGKIAGVVWNAASASTPTSPGAQRLTNATVTVYGVGTLAVNPNDAHWQFEVKPGTYTVIAEAPGYEFEQAVVIVSANNTTWKSLGLMPVSNTGTVPTPPPAPQPGQAVGKLSGIIWDAESSNSPTGPAVQIVTNATVTVSGQGTVSVDPQDAYWEFDLNPGTYTLIGSAPGYESFQKVVVVSANNTTWSSLGLTPLDNPAIPVEPPPTPNTGSGTTKKVCYPGEYNTWDVCFELTPKSQVTTGGYNYPGGGPSGQYQAPKYVLNLSGLNPATRLSKNFVLDEFMQSYKGQYAIFSPQTVVHWQKIRSALGVPIFVNSGFRSPGYNANTPGAAKFSRHMYGDAADVTAQGAASLQEIKNKCHAQGADYVSVYTSHVHCDWRNDSLKHFWGGASKPGAHHHHSEGSEGAAATAWVDVSNKVQAVGNAVYLTANYHGFDEGIPWVRWHISGPQFERSIEARQSVAFVPRNKGTYVVTWEVAGYLVGSERVVVE